jgi:hypothetical protein
VQFSAAVRLSVIFKSLKGIALLSSSGEQIRGKTLVTFDSYGSIHAVLTAYTLFTAAAKAFDSSARSGQSFTAQLGYSLSPTRRYGIRQNLTINPVQHGFPQTHYPFWLYPRSGHCCLSPGSETATRVVPRGADRRGSDGKRS